MGGVRAKGEVNITEMATVLHDAKVNKNRGGGGGRRFLEPAYRTLELCMMAVAQTYRLVLKTTAFAIPRSPPSPLLNISEFHYFQDFLVFKFHIILVIVVLRKFVIFCKYLQFIRNKKI